MLYPYIQATTLHLLTDQVEDNSTNQLFKAITLVKAYKIPTLLLGARHALTFPSKSQMYH
jgi:hypothetical protein